MRFSIYQESREGARKINQDRVGYCYSRDAVLMVVADGLGGHLHGELAAHVVVQYLIEAFQRAARPRLADPSSFLQSSVINAHHALVAHASVRQLKETPRTTCVAAIVQDCAAHWAHVGDSRLYHVREGSVHVRTRDHSRVQMLVDAGRLTAAGAARHPERSKIFNCVGSNELPRVDLTGPMALAPGDSLLLCTDGLWGPLEDEMLARALSRDELVKVVPALLDEAQARAGNQCDNLSVVAMGWIGDDTGEDAVSTQTLDLDPYTTRTQTEGKAEAREAGDLSDEEIELAIAEIRKAFLRQSHA